MKKLYTNKTSANKVSIQLLVFAVLILSTIFKGYGQVRVPFAPRTSTNTPTQTVYKVKGDFTMIGNTNLTLVNYSDTANNNADMRYIDVDTDINTLNSSSSTLTMSTENDAVPECSNIIYAGLYWTGRAGNSNTFSVTKNGITKVFDKRKVSIKGPNSATYTEVTADASDIYYPSGTDGNMYTAYAEITQYVQQNSIGSYFVADIATIEGNGGSIGYYGGWGMVVVYENSKMNWRDITVFDGHAYVPSATTNYDIDVTGFEAVQNGNVNVKLGLMAGEGDVGVPGDYFQIQRQDNGLYQPLSHSTNSITNFFNSSINTGGNSRNPNLLNNTGVDIAMFNINNLNNGIITNSQTSTRFRYGSTQDTYIIFNVTFSVDAYVPEPVGVLTTTSVTSPNTQPGEAVEYKVEIKNQGTEAINNTVITVPIPEYIDPSILTTNFATNYTTSGGYSDPFYDSNIGPFGSIVWNLGTLPLTNDPNQVLAELSFSLTVTENCNELNNGPIDKDIVLYGSIAGVGAISNQSFNSPFLQGYETNGVCVGEPIPVPIVVGINYQDYVNESPVITAPSPLTIEGCDENSITSLNARYPFSSTQSNDIKSSYVTTGYSASDNGTIESITYIDVITPNSSCPLEVTRTFTATDNCGKTAAAVQTITVQDTTNPVLTVPADVTVECDSIPAVATPTATDNCDADVTIAYDGEVRTDGACEDTYTLTRTWTATDNCSNTHTLSQTITVQDTTNPVLTVPADVTVECDSIPAIGTPTATDNCDADVTIAYDGEVRTDGACEDTYTLTRTWTATDNCSNTHTLSQTITVQDTTNPVLTVPADVTVECDSIPAIGTPTATDNCDADVTIAYDGEVRTDGACEDTYTLTRTWTATDNCSNTHTLSQTITVQDTTNPVLTVPADVTVECDSIPAIGTPTATDNCDADVTIAYDGEVRTDGACEDTYTLTRTWTATDNCSNTHTLSQTITVQDTTNPVLTVPADVTVECDSIPAIGTPTATDNCDADVTIAYDGEVRTDGACEDTYTLTRTWTATDNCSNTHTLSQTITVQDTTNPVLTVPADVTVECDSIPAIGTPTATDNCDADVTIAYDGEVRTDGACEDTYTLTRTWTATDNCSNTHTLSQTITVQDTTNPVLTVPADVTVECDSIPAIGTPTATDNCDADVTIAYDGEVRTDGACEDTYTLTRTWTATDNCSNTHTLSQTITVQDTTNPVLTVPADVTVECDSIPAIGTPTATDNCDADVTISYDGEVRTDGACEDTYTLTRTWTATDNCSNTHTLSQTITVQDTTNPVLTVPADVTVECDSIPAIGTPTATDNCDADVTIAYDGEVRTDGACEDTYTLTRTWTATDNCSNTHTLSQTITVQDTTNPVLTVPADVTVECDSIPAIGTPTATDNCDADVTIAYDGEVRTDGACEDTYTLTRTWTATDNCSNTHTLSQTITVQDTTVPTIICPVNITVTADPGQPNANITIILPTVSDNCDANVTYSNDYTGVEDASGIYNLGTTTVTYTATDNCGNTTQCSFTVTVNDEEAPEINCPPTITVSCIDLVPAAYSNYAEFVTAGGSATDNNGIDQTTFALVSETSDNNSCPETISRVYTISDTDGNSSECTQFIIVNDDIDPVLTVPADVTVECDSIPAIGTPTATDNCDADVTIAYDGEVRTDGACEDTYTLTRTWTATDNCSNTHTLSQTITVQDTTNPVLTVPADVTVECDSIPAIGTPTATDNCDADVTISYDGEVRTDGACEDTYTLTRTWTATDNCSNTHTLSQTITVQDTTVPTIICPVNITVTADPGQPNANITIILPTVSDNCDANVTYSNDYTGVEDASGIYNLGTTTVTYTATDNCGNTTQCSFTVTVNDEEAPEINCPPTITVSCIDLVPAAYSNYAEFVTAGGSATDNNGIDQTTFALVSETSDNNSCPETISRVYTISDTDGNSSECTQFIIVNDDIDPVLSVPADVTVECDSIPAIGTPTATDNCDADVTIAYDGEVRTDGACEDTYTLTRTWTATDNCSNTHTLSQTITVADTTAPVAPSAPADSTYECITDVPAPGDLTASDNCAGDITVTGVDTTDNTDPCNVIITRTWTFTDSCSNSSSVSQTITVTPITPPVVPANAGSTVECIADATQPAAPVVTDVCGNAITPVITENTDPVCEGEKIYTFTYTDCAGNNSVYTYTYTIDVTTAPVVPANAGSTVECIADATQPAAPVVTDVCGNAITPVITENTDPVCEGEKIYTFTYTDCAGNNSVYTYTYTIDVTTAPVVPANAGSTVECIADATQPAAPVVTDVCGNDITPVITENTDPVCEGEKIYTFTYTDCAGNNSVYTYTYTIDLTDFILPLNGLETVDNLADAVEPTPPTVTDNCGNPITPILSDVSNTPDCQGSIVYTFTYEDCAGNSADWTYTYTVILAPFTLPADEASNVECIADAVAPTPPTVFDANGNEVVPVMTENDDPVCEGEKIYTFTYTDCAGNTADWTYTYSIDVTTAPVVPANAGSTVECIADATQPAAPVVTDVCGNAITPVITENTDPVCEGEKIYTFTYTDCAGNNSVYTYTYTIDVTTAPVVPANAGSTVECIADATQPAAPVVTDVCGNAITPVITENTDPVCEGEKIYTFTYTDCAGNNSVYTYTYTIDVTTAPVVPANAGSTVECIADATQPAAPVVTDVCGNDITPVITENTDPVCEGEKIYTFTYTDCAGNNSVYTYTYTIDLTDFILPLNGLETVDNLADAVEPTPPTVTDNCGNPITPILSDVSNTPDCQGSIVYTFTYEDCAGNSADWTYTYTVILAPFTLPADEASNVECIADAVAPTPPTVFDANGNEVVPVMTENDDPVCEGEKIYTFTYTDCAGNTADWTYTYTIDVTTAPVVPANAGSTVECIADATQPAAPVVTDVCGNAITPVITENTDPVCEGEKIYTFTYTDCAGNNSVYTYTYTIDVTTAPVVPANAGSTVECIADATQPAAPVVTDVCGNAITPVITENTDPVCEGEKIYTFTYTDCAGNNSVYTYTYTIDVTTAPVVPANAGSTVECIADATQPAAPVVTDVCGNDITPVITENTDPVCEGEKIYTFTYTDCAGNNSVYTYTYTIDLTDFILPLNGLETVDNLADAVEPTPPTVTDNCGNPITPILSDVSNTPDCQGSIVYTFTYEDCAGNSADWTYTYTVILAPFTLPADEASNVECIADAVAPTPPTVFDANGNEVVPVMTENDDPVCEGEKIYTFTYTDCAGNTADWTYTYNVKDDIAPVVPDAPANMIFECIDDVPVAGNLTANDNCSGDITVSGVDSVDNSNPCNVIITRTWTFTDNCGNSSSVAHIITVTDTTAPIAPSAPADATFECIDDVPVAGNLTASDNCAGNITVGGNDSIDNSNPCNVIITRTWTFTDDCGNSSAVSQTITVTDTTAPVLISDLDTEMLVSCADVPDVPNLEFEDNCASNVNVDFSETNTFDETILMDYEIVRTWTVSDACGNENIYTQTLQVSLDEVVTEVIGEDRCYDDGVIDLNDFLQVPNLSGVWEMIEGDSDAILEDNIFDPTVLELSLDFKPGTGGIDYLFKYTTTDSGCISITYVSMNINADCIVLPCGSEDVVISTAITPNGDQYNEYFEIGGVELCGFITEVKIFNRWGALVYESKNYQNNWNGKSTSSSLGNAGTLPNGTYYYIVVLNNSGLNPFTGPVYIGTK